MRWTSTEVVAFRIRLRLVVASGADLGSLIVAAPPLVALAVARILLAFAGPRNVAAAQVPMPAQVLMRQYHLAQLEPPLPSMPPL
jgi:hypothetical protein